MVYITRQPCATEFEDIIGNIKRSNKDIKPLELHFFWTSGKEIKDLRKVNGINSELPKSIVGGKEKLSKKFFSRLEDLLYSSQSIPALAAKIRAKIIVDDLAFTSNKEKLEYFKTKYNDQFEVLNINDFKKSLNKKISSDDYYKRSSIIFENATAGNPAIASDIYRLIHPIILDKSDERIKNNFNFTYMDIDTFSLFKYSEIKSLIHNLVLDIQPKAKKIKRFKIETPKNIFKIQIPKNGANDIINISINNDLNNFKEYVSHILNKININGITKYNRKYFYTISGQVNELIQDIKNTTSYDNGVLYDIVNLTGPSFIAIDSSGKYSKNYSHLNFKRGRIISQRSWCSSADYIQNLNLLKSFGGFYEYHPLSGISGIYHVQIDTNIQEKIPSLENKIIDFLYKLDAASYMKKILGDKNQNFIKIKNDIAKNNPFNSDDLIGLYKYISNKATNLTNKDDRISITQDDSLYNILNELIKIGIKPRIYYGSGEL